MADLTFVQSTEQGLLTLSAHGPLVADWPLDERVLWTADPTLVRDLNIRLSNALEKLEKELPASEAPDQREVGEILSRYARSAFTYWESSPSDTAKYAARRTYIDEWLHTRTADLRDSRSASARRAAAGAPRLDLIATARDHVPLDLIPLGQRPRRGDSLSRTAFALPAFKAVWRFLIRSGRQDGALVSDTPLPIPACRAFVRSTSAPGWQRMRSHLRDRPDREVLADLPTVDTFRDGYEAARFMLHPQDLEGGGRRISDVHVFAHGRVGEALDDRFVIELDQGSRWMTGPRLLVTALDFDDALADLDESMKTATGRLLWLNCCDAGGQVGRALFSQALDLARSGAVVVAPRTSVASGPASDFARYFYEAWGAGATPGTAFLEARLRRLDAGDPSSLSFYCLSASEGF